MALHPRSLPLVFHEWLLRSFAKQQKATYRTVKHNVKEELGRLRRENQNLTRELAAADKIETEMQIHYMRERTKLIAEILELRNDLTGVEFELAGLREEKEGKVSSTWQDLRNLLPTKIPKPKIEKPEETHYIMLVKDIQPGMVAIPKIYVPKENPTLKEVVKEVEKISADLKEIFHPFLKRPRTSSTISANLHPSSSSNLSTLPSNPSPINLNLVSATAYKRKRKRKKK